MTALFILALIAAVVKLWIDLSALRLRVRVLEWGGAPAATPPAWQPYPSQPYPEQWQQPYAPQPWESPPAEAAPMPEPAPVLTTARVSRRRCIHSSESSVRLSPTPWP